MKLKFTNRKSGVPPDGFTYKDPDTGYVSNSWDEHAWLESIAKHRSDNGLPPIAEEDIYDQFCKVCPPGWCTYENGQKPTWFVDMRLGVADALQGTKALAAFVIAGKPLVSKELAASRSQTCARCYYNVNSQGCASCINLYGVIDSIAGGITTPSDPSLKICAVCKCSTKAKTRLPIEIIKKTTTQEHMDRFPSHCWIPKEIALTETVS